MEIKSTNLNFTSLKLSTSENLFSREKLIQDGKNISYQRVSRYNLNLDLDYTYINISQAKLQDFSYESLKTLKWVTSNPQLAETVSNQIDNLYNEDPELAKKYLILMEFLEDNNPDAAEKLAKRMDEIMKLKDTHTREIEKIENTIKKIGDKIQNANKRDLQSIAERVHIKLDVKIEIIQREESIKKKGEHINILSSLRSMKLRMSINIGIESMKKQADPIVVDLDGDGFDLVDTKNGVMFDINGDGKKELTSWIAGDDAFLALDRNLNGKIDSGKELFGDQNGALNGFMELSKLDWDKNGILNFKDPMFKKLLLFRDLNKNGESEPEELIPLYKSGISSINLNYLEYQLFYKDAILTSLSHYQKDNGKVGLIGDFKFFYI